MHALEEMLRGDMVLLHSFLKQWDGVNSLLNGHEVPQQLFTMIAKRVTGFQLVGTSLQQFGVLDDRGASRVW